MAARTVASKPSDLELSELLALIGDTDSVRRAPIRALPRRRA